VVYSLDATRCIVIQLAATQSLQVRPHAACESQLLEKGSIASTGTGRLHGSLIKLLLGVAAWLALSAAVMARCEMPGV
jgi:hypothetical protein